MVLGILVLLGAIVALVYLSQPKAQTAHAPVEGAHKRTKESIGVYSRLNSGETEATALKDKPESKETEQSVAAEKKAPVAEKTEIPATEKAEAPATEKTAKVAAPHHKKHHRSEETFFELAPNSGKHSPDNLDRVAN